MSKENKPSPGRIGPLFIRGCSCCDEGHHAGFTPDAPVRGESDVRDISGEAMEKDSRTQQMGAAFGKLKL